MKEIERKFLVDAEKLPKNLGWKLVRQGYLSFEPQVRVRIWDEKNELTIKSAGTLVRDEWNYPIPAEDAEALMKLCNEHIIEKERALIDFEGKEWCVDRFHGKNKGLITAEIELESENEKFTLPNWISQEVTGDERYLNINLVRSPICQSK